MISTDTLLPNELECPPASGPLDQRPAHKFVPAGDGVHSVEMTDRGVEVLAILNTIFDETQIPGDAGENS